MRIFLRSLIISLGLIVLLGLFRGAAKPLREYVDSSRVVYDRTGKLLRLTLSEDQKYRIWFRLEDLAPTLPAGAILKEDRGFYFHFGVNPFSLVRAMASTYFSGGRRMGGSTITMQVARMLYGIREKSISAKLLQILRATELELFHSKREILEAYLNLVPVGANIEGVGAASLVYFHKSPKDLSLPESLALIEIPQSPARRGLNRNPTSLLARASISRWLEKNPSDTSLQRDAAVSVQAHRLSDLPFRAPHFTDQVLRMNTKDSVLRTTLDSSLQSLLERRLKDGLLSLSRGGVRNGAAMLVDSRNLEVRALVGSADYFDDKIDGQVNGTEAKRSPGSTLKPFVYGLAIDEGLIHESTILKDAPTSFGSFDPENFDREYVGPISAKEALIRSRNVPAVSLFSRLKGKSLYGLLQEAGVTRMRGEKYYGYALPLGGSEVTMNELVGLYGSLANRGVFQAIHFFQGASVVGASQTEKAKLMSEEAAYIVSDMLRQNPRPNQGYSNAWVRDAIPVAWKTGTSHGFRDAWSVGFFGPYILAVWVGNFDGSSNPNLVGRDAAAPVFFGIVDALKAEDSSLRRFLGPLQPASVTRVKVCSRSGHLPGRYCHDQVDALFVPGKSPIHVCDVHRAFWVDTRTGLRACRERDRFSREEIFEVWPSDILGLFARAGLARRKPPPYGKECPHPGHFDDGKAPLIQSPKAEMTYLSRYMEDKENEGKLPLNAVTDGDARALYWFMNEEYLGKSAGSEPLLWKMHPGSYVVRAVDDQGRSDSRSFRVEVSE